MFPDFPREFWPAMGYELWRYTPGDPLATGYHWLNLIEAAAWFIIALYVGWRTLRYRKSVLWESTYVLLFVVFGLSDVWESQAVPVWLIAAKGLVFAGILLVRWKLLRSFYPGWKF